MTNKPEFRLKDLIREYIKVYYATDLKSTQALLDSALEDPNVDRIRIRFESDSKLEGFFPLEFEARDLFRDTADPVLGLMEYGVEQRRRERLAYSDGKMLLEHAWPTSRKSTLQEQILNFSRPPWNGKDAPSTSKGPPDFKHEVDLRIQGLYERKESADSTNSPIRICSLLREDLRLIYQDVLCDIQAGVTPNQYKRMIESLRKTSVRLLDYDIPNEYLEFVTKYNYTIPESLKIFEDPNQGRRINPNSVKMENLLAEYVCHGMLSPNQLYADQRSLQSFAEAGPSLIPGSEQYDKVFLQIKRMRFSFPAEPLRRGEYESIPDVLQKQKRDDSAFESSVKSTLEGLYGPRGFLTPFAQGQAVGEAFLEETDRFFRENLEHGVLHNRDRLNLSDSYVSVINGMTGPGHNVRSSDVHTFKAKLLEAAKELGTQKPKSLHSHPLECALRYLGRLEERELLRQKIS